MLNNFIYAKTKDLFLKELEAGNVLDEAIVFIEDTKEIWNHGTYFAGNAFNINYSDLVTLRNNNQLVPGLSYRIVDYVTTTLQEETQSANHPFDLIVTAISNNELSEYATACLHEGDTYFFGNKLNQWTIKYCLDNDTSRFAWASDKGVIYYMKDEFNNEAWYDFKNIMFLRPASWFTDNPKFWTQFTANTYFYTFSVVDGTTIKDDSLYSTNYHATDNHLGRSTAKVTKLNNTIFIDKPSNGVFNNIIADGHGNNTFGQSVWNNTIGHNFLNNIFNKNVQYNTIEANCKDNRAYGNFSYNVVNSGCYSNNFAGNVTKCTFKQAYYYNNFIGDTLYQCTFEPNNNWISDMPTMINVTFSNNCVSGDTSIYLNDLFTTNGESLLTALQSLSGNYVSTVYLTEDNKYTLFTPNLLDKVNNISDLENNLILPIYSDPQLDFESTSNNSDCYGYVGTLKNINVKGDLILIDSIAVYVREGNASPNLDIPVWCRLLKFNNDTWEILYQSVESKTIRDIAPETLFSFKMRAINEQNKLIKSTDKIAIVYVSAENAPVLSGTWLGFKAIINTAGGLQTVIANNSTGVTGWCPAFVIGYLSMANNDYVNIGDPQTITGKKQFNDGINISGKSFITSAINSGELKVLHNNSSKGFIVRTKNTSDNILPLEILSTNGIDASYQYDFPSKSGEILLDSNLGTGFSINNDVINVNPLIKITYSELKSLRDNSQLLPGVFYRITDYITTTSQENTKSAYHPFDIIVQALTKNTLSEDAKAILHEGDTYFAGSDLSAWELKYCLDNDETRFAWAAETLVIENYGIKPELIDGYSFIEPFTFDGQILIDTSEFIYDNDSIKKSDIIYEWGYGTEPNGETNLYIVKNDESYENEGLDYNDKHYYRGTIEIDGEIYDKWEKFEQDGYYESEIGAVYFLTKSIVDEDLLEITLYGKGVIYYMKDEFNNECPYDFKNILSYYDDKYYYTFSFINVNGYIEDLTLRQDFLTDDEGLCPGTHCNIIKPYLLGSMILTQSLNNNIFILLNEHQSEYFGCYNNIFNTNCYNNVIYCSGCISNTFGGSCAYNTFQDGCLSNTFGDECTHNTFGIGCFYNTFGNNCGSNTLGNNCVSNTLGNNCGSNTLGDNCNDNKFGSGCCSNTFESTCEYNKFGSGCCFNTFESTCEYNTFGNDCNNNIFGKGCLRIVIVSNSGDYNLKGEFALDRISCLKLGDYCYKLCLFTDSADEQTLQHVTIQSGVKGSLDGPLFIDLRDHLDKNYELKIAYNSKGELKQYCEADLVL